MLEETRLADAAYRDVAVRIVGIPADRFIEHGSVDQLRRLLRLDGPGIAKQIRETLARLKASPEPAAVAPTADRERPDARAS
jgi:deoxyxylulose-5-phosphate synthase